MQCAADHSADLIGRTAPKLEFADGNAGFNDIVAPFKTAVLIGVQTRVNAARAHQFINQHDTAICFDRSYPAAQYETSSKRHC